MKAPEYVYGSEAQESQNYDTAPQSEAINDGRQITESGVKAALRISQTVSPKAEKVEPSQEVASQDSGHEWTEEERRLTWESYKDQKVQAGIEQAKLQALDIATINKSYISFIKKKHGGDGYAVSEKEFLIWEDDYANVWKLLNDGMRDAHIAYDMKKAASVQREMFFTKDEKELHFTVEAQAGRFYRERAADLRSAIEASDNDEETKKKQLGLFTNFYQRINRHLELKAIPPDEVTNEFEDFDKYNALRTYVHNETIKGLNSLNDLARQYGLRPFTPRNFWTSEEKDQSPDMGTRMRYDRDVVEEYYSIAFRDRAETAERRLLRSMREHNMIEARPQYQAPPKEIAQPPAGYAYGPYGYEPPKDNNES